MESLAAMHQRLGQRLDGSYLPLDDAQELIDPVTADELRAAVREAVADSWVPRVDVQPRDFADARYRAYMVVTMCRIRYTLARGDVVSKPAAARWAIAHLEPSRHSLIERAAAYGDCGYDETLAFVRETLALASC